MGFINQLTSLGGPTLYKMVGHQFLPSPVFPTSTWGGPRIRDMVKQLSVPPVPASAMLRRKTSEAPRSRRWAKDPLIGGPLGKT